MAYSLKSIVDTGPVKVTIKPIISVWQKPVQLAFHQCWQQQARQLAMSKQRNSD